MAITSLARFVPGYRLLNGEKFNRIFGMATGGTIGVPVDQVPAMNVKSLTVANSLTVSGGSASSTIHGYTAVLVTPVQAVSAAATAFTLAVPVGATVTNLQFATLVAFTGATVSGEIGSASADASYVAATSVKNGGTVTLSPVATAAASAALTNTTSGGLIFTLAQGTPTAVGSGNLITTYVGP
jgi:hypothetical protein